MTKRLHFRLLLAVVIVPFVWPITASAAEQAQRRIVKGVVVYLNVMPAEILQEKLADHTDQKMHDGAPAGGHVYHVMVALFDEASGRRLGNAEVALDVADIFEPGKHVKLEPMGVGGILVYGNYVDLPGTGPYRLTVLARLQGMPDTIEAEFSYQHARL